MKIIFGISCNSLIAIVISVFATPLMHAQQEDETIIELSLFEVRTEGNVNTTDWMGWTNVRQDPYIYNYTLNSWIYVGSSEMDGDWLYIMRSTGYGDKKIKNTTEQEAFAKADHGQWQSTFFDPGAGDWTEKWFLDGEVGQVTNDAEGMTLTAGPERNDAHHMVLWTKESFKGDLKIEYEYTRLDNETNAVNILFIQATGSGESPYYKDIAKWSELRRVPAMRTYFNHMNTFHIAYAAFPNNEDTTAYIRGRRYMPNASGLQGTDLKPDYYPEGLFEPGVPHKIIVIKQDKDLFMRIENHEQVYYCHLTNKDLPPIEEGRIGIRHMWTRSAQYKNFRISVPGD